MRYLADTHVVLWWFAGDGRLGAEARRLFEREQVVVSAASVWEVSTKARIGKLDASLRFAQEMPGRLADQDLDVVPINAEHALRAGWLPGPHRDPFDRMIGAQALIEQLVLVSSDAAFDGWSVPRIHAG